MNWKRKWGGEVGSEGEKEGGEDIMFGRNMNIEFIPNGKQCPPCFSKKKRNGKREI